MNELGSTSRRGRGVPARATLLAAAGYLLLTFVMTYPLPVHPASTTFPGSSDRNLYIWTLAWDAHALLHQPLSLFDANIFHPYRGTLAYSENLIGAALLVAPVQWTLQNPVLTMNLAALVSVPLCALGAFLLSRRIGLGIASAWICGVVYAFAPPRFLRIDQAHLTAVEWIPFSLAFAHAYAKTGRAYDLRLALAFLSLQALTSGHGAVFLLFAFALWAGYALASGSRLRLTAMLRDAGIWGVLLLLPMVLIFLPYRRVQADVGLRRDLGDWTGSWTSFLSSPTHVDGWLLDHLGSVGAFINANTQAYLFPGCLALLLAAAAFLRTPGAPSRRRWRPTVAAAFAFAVNLAIAAAAATAIYAVLTGTTRLMAGPLAISLRSWWRPWATVALLVAVRAALARWVPFRIATAGVILTRWREALRGDVRGFYLVLVLACALLAIGPPYGPWRFVYWLPGLSFIRVPSRFMILAMLGVGVLCACGFERLTVGRPSRWRTIAAATVTVALCLEFAVAPFELVPNPVVIPAADRWLDTRPAPFVVAEVPLMDPTIPMLHSMAHWQKTVSGYSGWNPAATQEIATRLATFPDAGSLAALQAVGVTYVVVHGGMYPAAEWLRVQRSLTQTGERLTLRFSDGDDRVYELVPSAEDDAADHSFGSPTSTRTWHPSSRVSVDPGSTSAGVNAPAD